MTVPAAVTRHDPELDGARLLDLADLFMCLSRAFLPPPADLSVIEWGEPLKADLVDLAASLELDAGDARDALDGEFARWQAAQARGGALADSWLVEYSRLFLMPPMQVPLNSGVYLEGSLAGNAAQMMRACYETAGVLPDSEFRDLPDHVSMQLEFVGRLYERAARGEQDALGMAQEFVREFVEGWAEPLEQACAQAAEKHPAASVYRALARLLRGATEGR